MWQYCKTDKELGYAQPYIDELEEKAYQFSKIICGKDYKPKPEPKPKTEADVDVKKVKKLSEEIKIQA